MLSTAAQGVVLPITDPSSSCLFWKLVPNFVRISSPLADMKLGTLRISLFLPELLYDCFLSHDLELLKVQSSHLKLEFVWH